MGKLCTKLQVNEVCTHPFASLSHPQVQAQSILEEPTVAVIELWDQFLAVSHYRSDNTIIWK